jgi:hypothetical protein
MKSSNNSEQKRGKTKKRLSPLDYKKQHQKDAKIKS